MSAVPTRRPAERVVRWSLRAAVVILVGAVAVFLIRGTDTTTGPRRGANGAVASRVAGFDQVGFAVRGTIGASQQHCGLLAVTTAQQNQGLMNRRDLAGYDGMLFQFVDPTTTEFYMKDTLISLSIAWFDSAGHFVSATDMAPCGSAVVCPLYHADGPYTTALEVPAGRLGDLGVGPGATLTVGGAC